jgi:hypothetical protein
LRRRQLAKMSNQLGVRNRYEVLGVEYSGTQEWH